MLQEVTGIACQLIGQMSLTASLRDSIREEMGLIDMLEQLKLRDSTAQLNAAVLQAITALAVNSSTNQDQVR